MSENRPAKGSPEEKQAMDAWLDEVTDALGLDRAMVQATVGDVLRLTGTVAHNRSRPAAPVTSFLIGLAAGGDTDVARELIAKIGDLAAE